jgi:uncharacterized protein
MGQLQVVQDIYAAFGRGDFQAMLRDLAPDIEWEYGETSADVPWLAPQRGLQGVGAFLASLAALEFQRFELKALLEGPGVVVALIDMEAVVKATGRRIVEIDEAQIWRFNAAGQVAAFRHRVDTHQHRMAAAIL